jgi:protein-S-isoprenylcysteine O-methyltransferase Ste14
MIAPAPTDNSGVRFPPPLVYALPWTAAWLFGRVVPLPFPTSYAVLRVVGWALVAAWVGLSAAAIFRFRRAGTSMIPTRPTTAFVIAGPYRFTRNPMYLSLAALYLGLTGLFDTMWPLVLFPFVIVAMSQFVIAREERYLETKFGDAYRAYTARVRRWI